MASDSDVPVDPEPQHNARKRDRLSLIECLLASGLLASLTTALFRHHLFRELTFFGNADRLNNNLKVLKHHTDSLAAGHLDAWSDIELLGYDTFSLPYTFPNPFTYLTYLLGPENIYLTAGFISAALLLLAGVSAYVALRAFTKDKLVAVVGAVLYEFSTISVLKVSQNDMSFAVFILVPLLIFTIKRIDAGKLATDYVILCFLLFALLQFTFLQKAAYALILASVYGLYRSFSGRDWRIAVLFAGAGTTALVAASPRIWGLVIAMSQYTRGESKRGPLEISPFELLRWFDSTILGKNFTDPTAIANGINLTEGFLAYVSSLAPIILVMGLLRYRSQWFRLAWEKEGDASFFLWFLVFVFSVFASKPVFMFVYYLFLEVDFIHARIIMAGLLPMVILLCLLLVELSPKQIDSTGNVFSALIGTLVAIVVIFGIEAAAGSAPGAWQASETPPVFLDRAAVVRIALSTIAALAFVYLLKIPSLSATQRRGLFVALCVTIAGQTLHAAEFQVNGPHTLTFGLPFRHGDFYWASRKEFRIPDDASVERVHKLLERNDYRSVMICNREVAGGFCAAHVGEFWRLRLADGYYGLGVPKRIAMLPWTNGLGLRHVIFDSETNIPWALLGFLNVKYAVTSDDMLYRDYLPERGALWHPKIISNPTSIVPRAFFAKTVRPVISASEALRSIFEQSRINDVTRVSFAEGFQMHKTFDANGRIAIRGRGDTLVLSVERSDKARFLVLNELSYPGWTARIGGEEATIYPTNVVMRGVVLPPGATEVTFHYTPFVRSLLAKLLYVSGMILLLAGIFLFRRFSRAK